MNRLKKQVIVAAALVLLVVIGTILNSRQVAAQGPPGGLAVNIVNPLPVPVTGSTTVSGTLAATQSGAWNVGISGTPSIKVTNTPTTAVPTVLAPAASQLYASSCFANWFGSNFRRCSFATVPAGQTLFIETESIQSESDHGADVTSAGIGGSSSVVYIPMVQQPTQQAPTPFDFFTGALAGRIWVQAGDTPECGVSLTTASQSNTFFCYITGYLAPAE